YLVAEVFISRTVPTVCTRLCAQVHNAARELAPLGTLIVRLDFVLADGILGWDDDGQVDVADVQRLPVKIFRSLIGEGSSDLVVAPTERVLPHRRTARTALGDRGG